MSEPTGLLFDIDHFATHDGPGIRMTVYFKGCPLHCQWCHSPESQHREPELLLSRNLCISCGRCAQVCPSGAQRGMSGPREIDRARCVLCGRCAQVCPSRALKLCGQTRTVADVLAEAMPDKPFFDNSGGGVTLTGGEVLIQADFARALLKALKAEGIHTIVETSGYGDRDALLGLVPVTDVFYFDFKLWDADAFVRYVGGDVRVVWGNLAALSATSASIVLRAPMIPGVTDTDKNIAALYETALRYGVQEVHLLPYNQAAPEKYGWLDRAYALGALQPDLERLRRIVAGAPEGVLARVV